jgi:hypothetical protein
MDFTKIFPEKDHYLNTESTETKCESILTEGRSDEPDPESLQQIVTINEPKKYIPLKSFFSNKPDPKEVIEQFPKITRIRIGLNMLDSINDINVLSELKQDIFELQSYYMKRLSIYYLSKMPFNDDIELVIDRMNQLCDPKFLIEIEMSEQETVNGYKLYNSKSNFPFDTYQEFVKIWNEPDMTKEEFLKSYNDEACTEWSKMDENGESYVGFYLAPEDSEERKNAWFLTREKNGESLWALPYPKKFILKTIDIGCSNYQECVRYSNFVCEWMKRKIDQMTN